MGWSASSPIPTIWSVGASVTHTELLRHLVDLRDRDGLWMALPGEINRWWRNRQKMTVVRSGDGWQIAGPDSQRARIAYATLENDRVVYRLDPRPS
jgi:hypothetical protein